MLSLHATGHHITNVLWGHDTNPWKYYCSYLKYIRSNQVKIMHMSRQLSWRDMCIILTWLTLYNQSQSRKNFKKQSQLRAHKLLVNQAPGTWHFWVIRNINDSPVDQPLHWPAQWIMWPDQVHDGKRQGHVTQILEHNQNPLACFPHAWLNTIWVDNVQMWMFMRRDFLKGMDDFLMKRSDDFSEEPFSSLMYHYAENPFFWIKI